ncbi:MAG: tetratricopeptide (TPR) repeat protein, partial [Bradymonadia bacterium]
MPSNRIRPTRAALTCAATPQATLTRATLCLVVGVLLSFCLACSATAQPTQAQADQPNARTLTRDPGAGGPATIEVEDTDVFFESAELNAALESLEAGRPAAAIEAFATAQEGHAAESAFLYGYALYIDGQDSRALDALMSCASQAPLWSNHCLFWAAEVALRSDDPTQAERLAGMVDAASAFGARAHFLRSRALAALGEHGRAVDGFEEFVAAYPNAWYRRQVDFALGASLEALSRFDDAAAVYHRIEIEHPGTRDETTAVAAIADIRAQLSESVVEQITNLSSREAVRRAEALLGRRQHDELIELLRPVAASEPPGSPLFCEAEYTIAKAFRYKREHSDALPHFQQVIDHCEGDTRMKALYNAGRSAWTVDDDARALAFFQ